MHVGSDPICGRMASWSLAFLFVCRFNHLARNTGSWLYFNLFNNWSCFTWLGCLVILSYDISWWSIAEAWYCCLWAKAVTSILLPGKSQNAKPTLHLFRRLWSSRKCNLASARFGSEAPVTLPKMYVNLSYHSICVRVHYQPLLVPLIKLDRKR